MTCFIKRKSDFKTVLAVEALSYDVPVESIYDNTGTITISGTAVKYNNVGDWLFMDGTLFTISGVTPDTNSTRLSVTSWLANFTTNILWDEDTTTPSCTRLVTALNAIKTETDTVYRMSYLSIVNNASTSTGISPDVEQSVWNIKSFIRKLFRLSTIKVTPTISLNTLTLTIADYTKPTRVVLFDDGHNQLQTRSFSKDSVAKVTEWQSGTAYTYYLASDGTISITVPSERADGEWYVEVCNASDVPLDRATSIFSQNSNSHKIEFYSDRDYDLRDKLKLRLDGAEIHSYISYVGRKSTDSRKYYKTGELATTLTEILLEEEE